MFKIDRASNSITSLTTRTFEELGFKERANLQEWIAKEPSCLGEEFLIIQKEFSGFSDTHERLDILALDKQGSLVLIENKLDDTGRDVTWQALKYASYCSRLSKENVRSIYQEFLAKTDPSADARGLITEFLEADDQPFSKCFAGNPQLDWGGSGVRGVGFNFVAGRAYGRAELYIDRGDKEENKFIFDQLYWQKAKLFC